MPGKKNSILEKTLVRGVGGLSGGPAPVSTTFLSPGLRLFVYNTGLTLFRKYLEDAVG